MLRRRSQSESASLHARAERASAYDDHNTWLHSMRTEYDSQREESMRSEETVSNRFSTGEEVSLDSVLDDAYQTEAHASALHSNFEQQLNVDSFDEPVYRSLSSLPTLARVESDEPAAYHRQPMTSHAMARFEGQWLAERNPPLLARQRGQSDLAGRRAASWGSFS